MTLSEIRRILTRRGHWFINERIEYMGQYEEKDWIFRSDQTGAAVDKVELTFRTKNGESRQMLFSARRIEVDGRQLLIADTHDITDRKKAEEELIRIPRVAQYRYSDTNHALIHIMDEAKLLKKSVGLLSMSVVIAWRWSVLQSTMKQRLYSR